MLDPKLNLFCRSAKEAVSLRREIFLVEAVQDEAEMAVTDALSILYLFVFDKNTLGVVFTEEEGVVRIWTTDV